MEDSPQDDGTYYYCNILAQMNHKLFNSPYHSLSTKKYEFLRQWSSENGVEAFGICDKWEQGINKYE
ncbi:MAG: hypothetical protein WA061_02580 [Microgenomates group bacterium]